MEDKKEVLHLSFDKASDIVVAVLDEARAGSKTLEEALAIMDGAAQLLDPKAFVAEGESRAALDAKNFIKYFAEKEVIEW